MTTRPSDPGTPDAPACRPVVVLACGSAERGDDAVALIAVGSLPEPIRALAEIRPVGALDVEDLLAVPDGAACLVVDAAIGVEPGTIARGALPDLVGHARAAGGAAPHSSHQLPVADILGLAETLRGSLPPGGFVGLGAASFGFGEALSPPVAAALPAFVAAVAAEIERLAAG